MSDKIRALIVDDVAATRENIKKLMEFHPEIEAVGQAGTGEEAIALAKALRPDVILMDINMPGMDGIEATERLSLEVPDAAVIIMSVQGEQEYLRRAMMAGAKNYLTKPFTGDELIHAAKDAYNRERKVREALRAKTADKKQGKIICIFSGKGGAGKTTLAVNLAVALAGRPLTKVALVDADIQFGDVSLALNVPARSTLADVVAEKENPDDEVLSPYMAIYSDQLHILAAPARPEQAESITGKLVGAVLKQLRQSYDLVLVDTASAFNEATIAALDAADSVLLVAGLELPAVKNTKLALEIMQSLGYDDEKIMLVLNRATPEGGIEAGEVETTLKRRFVAAIPTDARTVASSINQGLPFVLSHPATAVARQMQSLAGLVAPPEMVAAEAETKNPRRFKLFGR